MPIVTAYNPLPISFTHGKGIWLYDEKGNSYIDSFSGIAVTGLGHAHPDVTKTICEQSKKLIHTSNMVEIPEQQKLAEKMTTVCGFNEAFFNNSGAEANETAIKIARLFGHKKGINTPSIIVMEGAFHGRTMGTLSASGSRKVRAGFDPLLPGYVRAPYNDIEAIKNIATNRDDVVAVMLETVQGESGINIADKKYLNQIFKLCHENDWLLIFDEVQTGNARLGALYDFMNLGIKPDVLTTAKGLGNGMPIGACLMGLRASDLIKPGNHGSTFGGNPLATSTALTVLNVIEKDKLCEKVQTNSPLFIDKLRKTLTGHKLVKEIRGRGYMIGIELTQPCANLRLDAIKNGLLLNIAAEKVIRLLPPLIIEADELDLLHDKLVASIDDFSKKIN